MKLIVLLGFAYLITGHPVQQNGMDEDRPTMEQHILDHLIQMVLSLNFSDIQPDLKTLPVSQLSSCITTEQRHLVNVCVSRAHCSLSSSQNFQDVETTDEAHTTSHEDDSHEHSHNYSHSQLDNSPRALFPMVMKCLVDTISPVEEGDGGEVNTTNLRASIIEKTLLSPAQKEIASESFVTCMSSNVTIPQDETERNETSLLVAQGDNVRTLTAVKAMLCVAKSIILNGCADMTVRKPAALEMVDDLDVAEHTTDTSQETGASDDKADMVGVLKKLHKSTRLVLPRPFLLE